MAEAFAKKWASENKKPGTEFEIVSRALTDMYEPPDSPASMPGIQVLLEDYALDLNEHRSCLLTDADVDAAHAIIGVSKGHVREILQRYPAAKSKTFALSSDVPDPWHAPKYQYKKCAEMMMPLVDQAMDKIISEI